MAAELVISVTSEKLTEMDWATSIQICEVVAHDERQAKDVIKAIKKRLGSKNSNTQLFTVMLLEMLMNNIGDHVHKQVIDTGLLPALVKIVKKKSDSPVREKIFLLLDATQTSLGGRSGRFPQYYSAYYELVNAGVKFPQRAQSAPSNNQPTSVAVTDASPPPPVQRPVNVRESPPAKVEPQTVPESSIVQKAASALEVLREVLDAVDTQHPEGAKDEFTLDLVEQCSFQKQRVMHLVMTSRDEMVVSQAIELNDQLEKVLDRHDQLISGRATSTISHFVQEDVEEEEEQLFRRIRKGKGHVRAEDEDREKFILRPPPQQRPLVIGPPLKVTPPQPLQEPNANGSGAGLGVAIPPPPAKHIEREKFFQENINKSDSSGLATHVRGLSLHSRRSSGNSYSLSTDSD